MTAERSGNAPRGGRPQGGRPANGRQQPSGGRATRPNGGPANGARRQSGVSPSRAPRPGGGPAMGNRGPQRVANGQPERDGNVAQPSVRRAGGQAYDSPVRRQQRGAAGWTTVRPWRPPRDNANEPALDDDSQPNFPQDHHSRPAQRLGLPSAGRSNAGAASARGRMRPPAWPGGGSGGRTGGDTGNQRPSSAAKGNGATNGYRTGNDGRRVAPTRSAPPRSGMPRPGAASDRPRRQGSWLPAQSVPPEDE